jgi:hypothetical protein
MPAFKDVLTAADIDAAIAYFQSKWDDEIYALWQERDGGGDALVRSSEAAAEDRTTRLLRQRFPDLEIGVPEATPVEDIVRVKAGGHYVYLTADGALAGGDCGEADAVAAGYELGLELGVNGTPAIVLPDGRLQRCYLPADRLLGALGLDAQQASLPKTR